MQIILTQFIINYLKKIRNYSANKFIIILAQLILFKSRGFYEKYELIEDAEIKIFSQNGEDGIIDYIVQKLNIKKPSFVEIGVGDYSECNTRFLYEMYYGSGLIIDINKNLKKNVSQNINLWKGNLNVVEAQVSAENINILLDANVQFQIDLFSVDIDGVDYWVVNKLAKKISKVFILEYNPVFGSELEVSVPNNDNFSREKYHYSNLCYGASLKAFVRLMDQKGYYLLGVNRLRNNAFFINKDYPKSTYFPKIRELSDSELTNFNFSESRDKFGELTYLSGSNKINAIIDCEVINLKNQKNEKIHVRNLKENL
jgi:hypothetical protein